MTSSADTAPPIRPGAPGGPDPVYQVAGTADGNEGRWARGVVLVNPSSGSPYAADSGTTGSSVALNDTLYPSRGATVTTDGALVVDPSAVTAPTSVADGADVALGTTTDDAGDSTVLGQLKQLVAQLGATLAVDASGTPVPVTVADGADTVLGSSGSSAGEASVLGQLLALVAALGGTLSVDASGSTVPVSLAGAVPTTSAKGNTTFGQVTVGTSPTLLLAANPSRISATIQNVAGGSALVLGNDSNVVAATPGDGQYLGLVVAAGGDAEDADSASAWYGVCASGSADVRLMEVVLP